MLPLLDGFNELGVLTLKLLFPTGTHACLLQLHPGRFELHVQARAQHLELWRPLTVFHQAEQSTSGNKPFVDVQVPPADATTIVTLKLVMIVVITLTVGNQGQEMLIPGRIFIGIRLLAPHVGQGVDEESHVVIDDQTGDACEQKHADDVTGQPPQKNGYSQIGHPHQGPVPAVLPGCNRIVLQIPNHTVINFTALIVFQHPANMSKPETPANGVRVLVVVINIPVVDTMAGRPDDDTVLQ